jgi:hypothetical protein
VSVPWLGEVLPSACAALGVPGTTDTLGLTERVAGARRIVVLLVDGMGYHLLPAAAATAPVLADVLAGRFGTLGELRCDFPSTTPTSLATLGTGARSGEHGLVGFTVHLPGTGRVLTHVTWRTEPDGPVPDPEVWQPVPRLLERAAACGVATSVLARPEFAGSGLTLAAYGAVPFVGAERSEVLAERIVAQVRAAEPPALVYGYHPTLDTTAHLHGIDSPRWRRAAASVGRLVERVAAGLPADAALLVTADHGALDVPATARVDVADDARLAAGVRVIAGEPRVRYLHTADGALADVRDAWRAILGARARVLTREEAIEDGLFGPVPDAHRARIGDLAVICAGDSVVLASGHEPDTVGALVAFHGSTTPVETAVPLITVPGGA